MFNVPTIRYLSMKRIILFAAFALAISGVHAKKKSDDFVEQLAEYTYSLTDKAPSGPLVESAFSPEAGSERLVTCSP